MYCWNSGTFTDFIIFVSSSRVLALSLLLYRSNTGFHTFVLWPFSLFPSFHSSLWKISMSAVQSHTHSLLARFPSDKRLFFHCAHGIMDIFLPPPFSLSFSFFSSLSFWKKICLKKMYRSFQVHYGEEKKKKKKQKQEGEIQQGSVRIGASIMENGLWL